VVLCCGRVCVTSSHKDLGHCRLADRVVVDDAPEFKQLLPLDVHRRGLLPLLLLLCVRVMQQLPVLDSHLGLPCCHLHPRQHLVVNHAQLGLSLILLPDFQLVEGHLCTGHFDVVLVALLHMLLELLVEVRA
jgi:hypothetical protein